MPWVIPSHQAPALLLKAWRPKWFSGLALVLGTIAPDLEFILRVDSNWYVSHTWAAQAYFTVPVVLLSYWLMVEIVFPWLVLHVPDGPPFHARALAALRAPRGHEWWTVAVSGWLGGLTHLFLDGFTHDDRSGWAVALWPVLRRDVGLGWLHLPVFDLLQSVLSLVLGAVALAAWSRLAAQVPGPAVAARAEPASAVAARQAWLAWAVGISGLCGALVVLWVAPSMLPKRYELALYGALDFIVALVVFSAAVHRLTRPAPRPAAGA